MPTLVSKFFPTPPQAHFLASTARVKGFGGAMAGGKTKTMCEAALDLAIDYPGIHTLIARQRHTSIIDTTKKRMMAVVPPPMIYRKKESQGEDWVMLYTTVRDVYSKINFIGLDDPVKWFSSEIGALICDEAHEMAEEDVRRMRSRLRQRCPACELSGAIECDHFPLVTMLGFNPENPNHWLRRWFILGAARTEFGYYKKDLYVTGGEARVGDAEFVIAKATDNPYNSRSYIEETLGGMSSFERKRYLEGQWLFVSGKCFFDTEALSAYSEAAEQPMWDGAELVGNVFGGDKERPIRFRRERGGPWQIFRAPVKKTDDHEAHRYIVSVDPSSGGSTDYSGIQILDVEDFAQVAEFQGKMDPDLVADQAFRAAVIYNGALVVVETTGGWGASVVRRIDHDLLPYFRGSRETKPRMYLRRVEDRLKKLFTDKMGWNTDQHSRALMLDALEEAIRKRLLVIRSERTIAELLTFVWQEKKERHGGLQRSERPGAQAGENDDLVMSLAMAVAVHDQQPKQLRRSVEEQHTALIGSTGY